MPFGANTGKALEFLDPVRFSFLYFPPLYLKFSGKASAGQIHYVSVPDW